MKLAGKRVVLTGASGGIGDAVAKALALEGCRLLLVGRNVNKLRALKAVLPGSGHCIVAVDLRRSQARARLLKAASVFKASILINGLGTNRLSLLEATSDQDFSNIIATNLQVPMLLCRDFLPLLRRFPDAAIINIGSILGSIGYAGSAVYCASKFGLRGFTESLRREVADSNIHVIYFAPRATNTQLNSDQMQQLNATLGNAVDEPHWVASRLVMTLRNRNATQCYLGKPESFFVRLNGLFPNLVDKALIKQLPVIRHFANLTG